MSGRPLRALAACVFLLFGVTNTSIAATTTPAAATTAADAATTGAGVEDFKHVAARHPAGAALRRLFPTPAPEPTIEPTGLTKKDYLPLIAGNVDFFKQHQDAAGAIIDPHEKAEKQYSTPAFALAAATILREQQRDDLLDPAVRAFDFALTALVNRTTANAHPDFYIPMLVHAHRVLRTRVPAEQAARWDAQFKAIVPQQVYKDITAGANWNVVNVAGEALRRKDGLVAREQRDAQQQYLDAMLERQQRRFTRYGMYADPNVPLAYDAFPRLWLEDMLADGAYADGTQREAVEQFLTLGGFSSLLLLSPSGEWPGGGRSAQHQWNEAEHAVICEINANKWKSAGRDDIAGAFKRSARLGLKSMYRWQRPSGEMWIVKNRADPQQRHGFEGYSFHSQYNLLAVAMLCVAHARADDAIAERATPSEVGTYVFELAEPFTFVVAASGGYYALVNTAADHHYDATGLQRVHRAGVEVSPLSGTSGKAALSPGIQWRDGDEWTGLGHFHRYDPPPRPRAGAATAPAPQRPQRVVAGAKVDVTDDAGHAGFTIRYELDGPGARAVTETYSVSDAGVRFTQTLDGPAAGDVQVALPVLLNDGADDTSIGLKERSAGVQGRGGALTWTVESPAAEALQLAGPRARTHNGFLRAAVAPLPAGGNRIEVRVTLEPIPLQR